MLLGELNNTWNCWNIAISTDTPACALPYEDWHEEFGSGAKALGKLVKVFFGEKTITCELRDSMPHRANIRSGCGILLNPAALKALELNPPLVKVKVSWEFVKG